MRLGSLVSIGVALALAPCAAGAQDSATRARQLFEAGVAAMDRGQPAEAASYFDQSYHLYPRASTSCNMGVVQERLGQPCAAVNWYRNCAAIDGTGELRAHANQEAAQLAPRCQQSQQSPFVSTQPVASGGVQVVEGSSVPMATPRRPSPDHTLLGVGIGGVVLGGGALVGAIFSALASQDEAAQLPEGGGTLVVGSPEADHYDRATLYRDLALGLYVGAGLIGGLGLILVVVDLARPGVFGGSAARESDLRLTLSPTPGGAFGELSLRF